MSLVSRSIPGFFGGVSQKIPALRHPTQGSAQDNGLATVVDGLFKRPGTRHVATLATTGANGLSVVNTQGEAHGHIIDRGTAGRHALILKDGSLMVYDLLTGTPQVVTVPNGQTYLNSSAPATGFRCLTVADTTFIVNTQVVPAMTSDTTPSNPGNLAYVNVQQVASNATYVMTIDGNATGYTAGDAPKCADVAVGLANAFNTLHASKGYTAYRVADTNCIRVQKTTGTISTVTISDTYNNEGMMVLSNGVEKYSDLPPRFETGYVVSIQGTEGVHSKYYVKWNGKAWEECAQPGLPYKLDPATMPHRLKPNTDGTWVFERITQWADRLTGDDKTAPKPSYVGNRIEAVYFHRNRLGFLASDCAILSKAGDYFNFFPASAQQILDTDPIDLSAGSDNVTRLTHVLGFNQTLLVWSNTSQQFVLSAGDILSPRTARLMPLTSFPFKPGVAPASAGNKAIFAAPFGDYTQVNLYRVADNQVTNTADDITEDCPRYIPASVSRLSSSVTVRALVGTSHAWTNEVYVWKWEQDEQQRLTQRAWQKFTLDRQEPVRILCAHWVERTLYLLICTRGVNEPSHHFTVEKLEFGLPVDDFGTNVPLLLDRAVQVSPVATTSTTTELSLPYPLTGTLAVLRKRTDGLEPEELTPVSVSASSPTTTRVILSGVYTGQQFVVGQPFMFTYKFTEPVMQDRDGVPFMATFLKHVRTLVRYVATGYFRAEVSIPLRDTYVYPFNGRTTGQPNQAASMASLSTGEFSIPVQAKASGVEVTLKSESYLPCRFPYGEWVGDVTMKASR